MKHKSTVYMGAGVGIFILAVLMLPLLHDNSNSTIEISKVDAVAFYSYYGTIFGGLVGGVVGGMFTYLGVKMSLDNQADREKQISDTYKDILTLQLQSSYRTVTDISNTKVNMVENIYNTNTFYIPIPKMIVDNHWNEHLMHIKILGRNEIEIVGKWFASLEKLESGAAKTGKVHINWAKSIIREMDMEAVKLIIAKLESGNH